MFEGTELVTYLVSAEADYSGKWKPCCWPGCCFGLARKCLHHPLRRLRPKFQQQKSVTKWFYYWTVIYKWYPQQPYSSPAAPRRIQKLHRSPNQPSFSLLNTIVNNFLFTAVTALPDQLKLQTVAHMGAVEGDILMFVISMLTDP